LKLVASGLNRRNENNNEPAAIPDADALPESCAFADRCDLAKEACRRGEITLRDTDNDRQVRCLKLLGITADQGAMP